MTLMLLCTMEQKQQFDILAMLEVIGANLYAFLYLRLLMHCHKMVSGIAEAKG